MRVVDQTTGADISEQVGERRPSERGPRAEGEGEERPRREGRPERAPRRTYND